MLLKISTNPHVDKDEQKHLFEFLQPRAALEKKEEFDQTSFMMFKTSISRQSKIVVK